MKEENMLSKEVTSKMKAYNEKVKKRLPGGVHYNFHLPWEETPIHFVKAERSRVWDMDGNEYLDLYARFGAQILGHGNAEYSEALKETIDRVLSVSHCDMDDEALEQIAKFIPSAEMIRFGLSGTEIVQNALRLARAWTGKNRFIRFEGHYHGNADNIMGGKANNLNNPIPLDYIGDLKGTAGRATDSMESQSYILPWNDEQVLEDLLSKRADEVAAIIMEPVCVNGGGMMPDRNYLKKVRELCDTYNIVLIFDEIITGLRMGLGGAQTYFDVLPDLTTLGKAISGGGVPVSALVGKQEIMQLLVEKKVTHAGTFNGYPLGTAAVKSTFEILSRNNGVILKEMNDHAKQIYHIMENEAKRIGLPLVIQGPPGCTSYHCRDTVIEAASDYTFDDMYLDIVLNDNLAKNGILVSSISRIYPNISLNQEDVIWFQERVGNALEATKEIYEELLI